MGLLLEFEGKELFKKYKIPLNPAILVETVSDEQTIQSAAEEIGYPVVIKSQVLSGGRGKRGWIKLAKNPVEVLEKVHTIQESVKSHYGNYFPLLIEKAAKIEQEIFISMVIDADTLETVVLFSTEGGIAIEELAKEKPEAIKTWRIPYGTVIFPYYFLPGLANQGLTNSKQKIKIAAIISTLVKMMKQEDLLLAEINPLIIGKDGSIIAVDSRIVTDDDAIFRHPERKNFLSEELRYTNEEADAKHHGLAYVELGGEIGMLSCGAGMGMATADLIQLFGTNDELFPRNFLDVGGGASPEKVEEALRIMLTSGDVKAILINAFGGITRLDDVAKGILKAKEKYKIDIPMVVRLTGTNQKEGVAILKAAGMDAFEEMEPAIEQVILLAKEVL